MHTILSVEKNPEENEAIDRRLQKCIIFDKRLHFCVKLPAINSIFFDPKADDPLGNAQDLGRSGAVSSCGPESFEEDFLLNLFEFGLQGSFGRVVL